MKLITQIKETLKPSRVWIFMVPMALAGFTSCVNDGPADCPQEETVVKQETERFFIRLKTQMRDGTRSGTTSEGESEHGRLDAEVTESSIVSLNTIFCEVKDEDDPSQDKYLTHLFGYPELSAGDNSSVNVTLEVTDPNIFFGRLSNRKLRLYLVANYNIPSEGISPASSKISFSGYNDKNPLGTFERGGRVLPLVNSCESGILNFERKSSDEIKELFYASVDNSLNISKENEGIGSVGTISLERVVARIDYKGQPEDEIPQPGIPDENSLDDEEEVDGQSNIYSLFGTTNEVYLQIDYMQLFNVSEEEYLFRHSIRGNRSSAGYTDTDLVSLFGKENDSNDEDIYSWIVDTDWQQGDLKGSSAFIPYTEEYISNSTRLFVKDVLATGANATHIGSAYGTDTRSMYHPCWYVSENTIPSVALMEKTDGNGEIIAAKYATGIKFLVKVLNKYGKPLVKNDPDKAPQIVFGTSEDGKSYITITMPNGYYQDIPWDETLGGYYLTYYALINHNVPENWTEAQGLNPMHVGVVRNNVYQLTVKSIRNLPNPEEPKSMDLEIRVLPWNYKSSEVEW
ncbi:MAG: fimbria major subunit [Muribaculaceae bacterium]|nr:fimbria major subunit [Muribaculaceae bacterium]